MADTKILIVVNGEEAGKAYSQAVSEIGVAYDMAPSFQAMLSMVVENRYNGLVLDILTLVRCSKSGRYKRNLYLVAAESV